MAYNIYNSDISGGILMKTINSRLFILLFILSFSIFGKTTIRISVPEEEFYSRNSYYIELLKLVLDKTTKKYGSYKIINNDKYIPQNRYSNFLGEGPNSIDIMWTMTNIDREKLMLPVRIPLLKGLMGCRLIIINKDNKNLFGKINNVNDLKKLTAVQGHDWPDTDILIHNKFKVEKATNYEGMFKMIEYGRGDYFPRAINEPYEELKLRPDLNLMVDEKIMLFYFSPIFFFVDIKNIALHDRIEEGLNMAIKDGSFDKFFYNHPSVKTALSKVNFKNMKIFELENPYLTEETKKLLNKKEYILKIK